MNTLYQPYLNPLKFYKIDPAVIPQYVSKHMDDYQYERTLRPYHDQTKYFQPWKTVDAIRLQIESNYGTLTIKIFRCNDGVEIYSTNFTNLIQNFFNPDFYIRQLDLDLITFPPDFYYAVMDGKYISNIFETKEEQEDTLYIEFSHYEKRGGLRFDIPENNFTPAIRVPGIMLLQDVGSEEIIYEDDPMNHTMIESKDFDVWDLFIGNCGSGSQIPGLPPWLMKKIKGIAGCSTLKIDGRLYTKMKGSKWENFKEDRSQLVGAKHEMRDRYNREALIFEDDEIIPGIAAAALMTDTKGFGMGDNSGDDYLEIPYVQ